MYLYKVRNTYEMTKYMVAKFNDMEEIKISPSHLYKERVARIKDSLPRNYITIILKNYPEYDTAKGYSLIRNVVSLRTSDVKITDILERIEKRELTLDTPKGV
jgi:hypothetical protein